MSAVEGADTTAALRARLDEIDRENCYEPYTDEGQMFDALRAVLDLCDRQGDLVASSYVRLVIATALGTP